MYSVSCNLYFESNYNLLIDWNQSEGHLDPNQSGNRSYNWICFGSIYRSFRKQFLLGLQMSYTSEHIFNGVSNSIGHYFHELNHIIILDTVPMNF